MKILLTSTGFTNTNIKNKFLNLLNKDIKNTKILFIITAAQNPDAIRILPACLDDLTGCGITDENIRIYDMYEALSEDEIKKYDAIYVCGGDTRYLENRMNKINFKTAIQKYSGIYIGVSAGSIAAQETLKLIENKIDVHCEYGSENKPITTNAPVNLTDNQAIYISKTERYIFE